jgi:hypothetical protein
MKHKISGLIVTALLALTVSACKSNPHKAQDIKTDLDKAERVSGNSKVGLKDGEMVVLDKVQMSERLRDLQNGVYSLEDKVYGNRKFGSLGLYGEYKSCKRKIASRQYGGTGTMVWTEPLDRVTDKEEELKVGLDEKKELVGVSEEYLKDRIQRFQGYKMILQKRSDEFEERISECSSLLQTKELDNDQPSKVMVSEASKASADKTLVNQFMCGFVRSGASLQSLMINVFAKGWLSLSDFKLTQNIISAALKDSKGDSKPNGLLFNGWKLAFDQASVTVGELLNDGKDARLQAWTYDNKAEATCLSSAGSWNQ